jgi:hypothetical protein
MSERELDRLFMPKHCSIDEFDELMRYSVEPKEGSNVKSLQGPNDPRIEDIIAYMRWCREKRGLLDPKKTYSRRF